MIKHKFAIVHPSTQNDGTFDPKEYFSCFHYFELYQPNKEYVTTKFQADYGKGTRTYEFVLCKMTLINDNGTFKIANYVCAQEILTKEEKKMLEPFCTCDWHIGNFFTRLFIDKDSIGCIGSENGNISQYRINMARKNMDNIAELN